jgi:hypothetical protein
MAFESKEVRDLRGDIEDLEKEIEHGKALLKALKEGKTGYLHSTVRSGTDYGKAYKNATSKEAVETIVEVLEVKLKKKKEELEEARSKKAGRRSTRRRRSHTRRSRTRPPHSRRR